MFSSLRSGGERQVLAPAPLAPRAVVKGDAILAAELVEPEHEDGRRHARAARRDQRCGCARVDTGRLERGEQPVWRQHRARLSIEEQVERQAGRARDVARADALARLGHRALKALARARVHDLGLPLRRRNALHNLGGGAHGAGLQRRGKGRGRRRDRGRRPGLDRQVETAPRGQSAVEDRRTVVPEGAQHPPEARRREDALAVVAHDVIVATDTKRLHGLAEVSCRRHHVRQRGRVVRPLSVAGCKTLVY
mmetsp:Transcript_27550/g.80686  ORF Transcript_27550/g.80686 Transcript_27550/m.80686 type:complete len:251 (+) Transcript_27550:176-928(+)